MEIGERKYLLLGSLACKIYKEKGVEAIMIGEAIGYNVFKWGLHSDPIKLVEAASGWGTVVEITREEYHFLKQKDLIIMEDGFCWKVINKEQAQMLLRHEVMDVFGLSSHDRSEYSIESEEDMEKASTLAIEVGFVFVNKED